MRLFIGLYPPEEILNYIYNIENLISSTGIHGNFTKKENIHLTLKFLGEVDEDKLDDIKNIVSNYKNLNLKLKLNKLSYFKRKEEAILWIGLGGNTDLLEDHFQTLDNEFHLLGFQKEYKNFKPHITIARKINSNILKFIDNINLDELTFTVNEINLIQSTLTKQGPIYKTLY